MNASSFFFSVAFAELTILFYFILFYLLSAPNLSEKPRRVLYVTYSKEKEGDYRYHYYHHTVHHSL